jgi:arabinose-5-phosphate isomerase
MTKQPRSIGADRLAVEAVQILEKYALGGRLVVLGPGERLMGAVTFHDLLAAGVV